MSDNFFGVSHVSTVDQLPAVLERGRVYFVDEEAYIVIDHGNGPVIYGNRPGVPGWGSSSDPDMQDQIDYLTQAVFNILAELARMTKSYDTAINILAQSLARLYPSSYDEEWKPDENTSAKILTTEDGTQYKIIDVHIEDGAMVFQLETDEATARYLAEKLKAGDTVEVDNTDWKVITASKENGASVIVLELP